MDREIKFKLFQRLSTATGVPKYVEYTDGFSVSQDGKCWYDEHEVEHSLGDKWVVVQWTGLQDKNKTDIYEGDVIKTKMHVSAPVVFSDGAFRYKTSDGLNRVLFNAIAKHCEVIGNTYQKTA